MKKFSVTSTRKTPPKNLRNLYRPRQDICIYKDYKITTKIDMETQILFLMKNCRSEFAKNCFTNLYKKYFLDEYKDLRYQLDLLIYESACSMQGSKNPSTITLFQIRLILEKDS